ncbi:MAG: pilus assembly protein PilM, partial [Planctomycetes bacterium]|nr:pilus assembly protein PilM [Planctomycetota bacterium]
MFTSKSIWGLDIGESSIKAVLLQKEKDGGKLRILDYDYVELDTDLKAEIGASPVIQDALQELAGRRKFAGTEVCVSVSSKIVNARSDSLPGDLNPKTIQSAILLEARKQIPFPLEEVQWAYHRFPDRDGQIQFSTFAVRNEQIEQLMGCLNLKGLKTRGIQVPGVALYNYISLLSDTDDVIIAIDFGEKSTTLIVIHDGCCWLRSLPLSGHDITELLKNKFRITTKEAMALKQEMSKSSQKAKLFHVIEPALKELVIEIKRSVNFRKTQVKSLNQTKFIAFGGSTHLPSVTDY